MNRRAFLSKSWIGALIPSVAFGEKLEPVSDPYYQYRYKGWLIHWSGFKSSAQSEDLVGQWTAQTIVEQGRKYAYSSVPGATGFYYPGFTFDVGINSGRSRRGGDSYRAGATFDRHSWQQRITRKTKTPIRDEQQRMGLKDLLRFIDEHGGDAVAAI